MLLLIFPFLIQKCWYFTVSSILLVGIQQQSHWSVATKMNIPTYCRKRAFKPTLDFLKHFVWPDFSTDSTVNRRCPLIKTYLAILRPLKKRAMSWSEDCQGSPRALITVSLSTISVLLLKKEKNKHIRDILTLFSKENLEKIIQKHPCHRLFLSPSGKNTNILTAANFDQTVHRLHTQRPVTEGT